jgi:predicted DNA-binding protein
MSIKERLQKLSKSSKKDNIIYLRVSDETLERIAKLQETLGIRDRSKAVRMILEDHLESLEKETSVASQGI